MGELYYEEWLDNELEYDLKKYHFSPEELQNPITKASLAAKLAQYRQRKQYPEFQIPAIMLG